MKEIIPIKSVNVVTTSLYKFIEDISTEQCLN